MLEGITNSLLTSFMLTDEHSSPAIDTVHANRCAQHSSHWHAEYREQHLQMALNLEGGTPHKSIMASSNRL